MRFCSEKVLKYLENPKDMLIATMRNWHYRLNQRVVLKDCNGRIIGYGIVADIAPPNNDVLKKWLPYSGFNTVDEWLSEARRLHKGSPRFVYLIYIIKLGGSK